MKAVHDKETLSEDETGLPGALRQPTYSVHGACWLSLFLPIHCCGKAQMLRFVAEAQSMQSHPPLKLAPSIPMPISKTIAQWPDAVRIFSGTLPMAMRLVPGKSDPSTDTNRSSRDFLLGVMIPYRM